MGLPCRLRNDGGADVAGVRHRLDGLFDEYYEFPARPEAKRRLEATFEALKQVGASPEQIREYGAALVNVVLDAIELPERQADI